MKKLLLFACFTFIVCNNTHAKYEGMGGYPLIKDGITYVEGPLGFLDVATCEKSKTGHITIPSTIPYEYFDEETGRMETVMLTVVTIGITYYDYGLDKGVFSDMEITGITIPNTVTYIGSYTFSGCTNLKTISIPNSVTEIGFGLFKDCINLETVELSENITGITWEMFYNCKNLTKVNIPKKVTAIDTYAFAFCRSLPQLEIPRSLTSIGFEAFYACGNLSLHISDLNAWCKINFGGYGLHDWAIFYHSSLHLFLNGKEITDLAVPSTVSYIPDNAFNFFTEITSVTIPNSVNKIGRQAFVGCHSLQTINIPNSVTEIGYEAFDYCPLRNIYIDMTNIPQLYFSNEYIENKAWKLTFGPSVKTIGDGLLGSTLFEMANSAPNKMIVVCKGQTPPLVDKYRGFEDHVYEDGVLVIPFGFGTWEKYRSTWPWSQFKHIKRMLSGQDYTSYAYKGHNYAVDKSSKHENQAIWLGSDDLNSVTIVIPNEVTIDGQNYQVNDIREDALANYPNLQSITLPTSLEFLSDAMFDQCDALEAIYVPWSCKDSIDSLCYSYEYLDLEETNKAQQFVNPLVNASSSKADKLASLNDDFFERVKLYVPTGMADVYSSNAWFGRFKNIIETETQTNIHSLYSNYCNASVPSYFTLQGQRITQPQRGQLVIARYSDGTSRKMVVK